MAIPYVLRRPRLPVIVVAGDRAFRAISTAAIQKILRDELKSGIAIRLLNSEWAWFDVLTGDVEAIAPSFVDFQPPTKHAVVALVNGRANKVEAAQIYQPRSLSSRTREEVFQELLALLPVG